MQGSFIWNHLNFRGKLPHYCCIRTGKEAPQEKFVSGCKRVVRWYYARNCVIAFVRLIYGWWLSITMDCHTRCFGLYWAFLRLLWSHPPTGLVSLCSFYILWKSLRRLLAVKTSNTINKCLHYCHNRNLDTHCPYYCHLRPSPNLTSSRASSHFSYFLIFIFILCGCNICIWRNYQMRNISSAAKQSCPKPTSNKNPIVCFCCGSAFLAPVSNCRRVFDGDTWNLCTLGTGHYLAGGEGYYVWG